MMCTSEELEDLGNLQIRECPHILFTHWAIRLCECGAASVRSCLRAKGSCRDASWPAETYLHSMKTRKHMACGAVLKYAVSQGCLYVESTVFSR